MAFERKYYNKGPASRLRITNKEQDHIINILQKYDKLYGANLSDDLQEEFNNLRMMYEKALDALIKKSKT